MERTSNYSCALFFSSLFAILSFSLCLAAEFKKLKKREIRLDGKLCYLPQSDAFGLGMAALTCVTIAQIMGSFLYCRKFRSREQGGGCKVRKPTVPCILLVFSWISFGIVVILISTATSMSRTQPFGQGWLDGECYLVKDGIYAGSGVLALLALGSIIGSATMRTSHSQEEENRKIHTQIDLMTNTEIKNTRRRYQM